MSCPLCSGFDCQDDGCPSDATRRALDDVEFLLQLEDDPLVRLSRTLDVLQQRQQFDR